MCARILGLTECFISQFVNRSTDLHPPELLRKTGSSEVVDSTTLGTRLQLYIFTYLYNTYIMSYLLCSFTAFFLFTTVWACLCCIFRDVSDALCIGLSDRRFGDPLVCADMQHAYIILNDLEHLARGKAGFKADLFSAGVVLHVLLTRHACEFEGQVFSIHQSIGFSMALAWP